MERVVKQIVLDLYIHFVYPLRMNEKTQRLYDAAQHLKGISGQSNIARLFGTSPQVVRQWEIRGVAASTMVAAEHLIGCLAHWVDTGEGNMTYAELDFSKKQQASVPVLPWELAMAWTAALLSTHPKEQLGVTCAVKQHTFAVKITDDSNAPIFPVGAWIVVEPSEKPVAGQWVVVHDKGALVASLKQFVMDGAIPLLKSGNPAYPVRELTKSTTLIGVVKQLIQTL